ncbi:cupin domain-containing protein [Sphingobium sp. B2]|uniref:cupin domain-containing protein n=1 Tax=Sphingobium sp. B2 TaxID=2583228 RepID=UPI0011A245D4|nr:cupin domain-containing protein [Sphingobium sp. B2]
MAAYADDIRLLQTRGGYQSFDLIRLKPDDPERAESRKKFLSEHIHSDDGVRYCIEGQGQFYIRTGDYVHALEVTVGDLISVPAGALHWFNGGEKPSFTAIRLFTTPDGWAATFTGAGLPGNIPLYEGER